MTAAVERLVRIRAACIARRPLEGTDAIELVKAIDALDDGRSLDEGMRLVGAWRLARARAAVSSTGATVKHLYEALGRYRSAGFNSDRDKRREPTGQNADLYRILIATRGKVPSEITLRRWRASP